MYVSINNLPSKMVRLVTTVQRKKHYSLDSTKVATTTNHETLHFVAPAAGVAILVLVQERFDKLPSIWILLL